jgi:hypothetical protein
METVPASPDALSPLSILTGPDPLADLPLAKLKDPERKALSADTIDTSPDDWPELAPLTMPTDPPPSDSPLPATIETSAPPAPDPEDKLNIPERKVSELKPTERDKSPDEPSTPSPVEIRTKSLDDPVLLPRVIEPLRPLTLPPLINSTFPPVDINVDDPPRT